MASNIPVIVQGNSFSLAIPLQIYIINGDQMDLEDYTPDPTDEVSVQLKGSRRNYTYTPTIDGNVANIDLTGNELADNYSVVVSIVKDNGQRLRSFRTDQFFIVESSDDLTTDDIIQGLEENVIYLNAQAFIAGADGRGIERIQKTGTSGLVDTYTIYYTDNTTTTFQVTNGANGQAGAQGVGITSIEKTGTSGLVDTYTITLSNGQTSTFEVTNGRDGHDLGLVVIVDDLTTGGHEDALSAEQGKILNTTLNDTTAPTSTVSIPFDGGGRYIKADGTVAANGGWISTPYVAVNEGDEFVYSGTTGSASRGVAGYAYDDTNDTYTFVTVLIPSSINSALTDKLIIIPSGVTHILAVDNKSGNASLTTTKSSTLSKLSDNLGDIASTTLIEDSDECWHSPMYVQANGNVSTGGGRTAIFDVEINDVIELYDYNPFGPTGEANISKVISETRCEPLLILESGTKDVSYKVTESMTIAISCYRSGPRMLVVRKNKIEQIDALVEGLKDTREEVATALDEIDKYDIKLGYMFENIACIGDSMSRGTLGDDDIPDLDNDGTGLSSFGASWCSFLAKRWGCKSKFHYANSGTTTYSWLNNTMYGLGRFIEDVANGKIYNAYLIAYGHNDNMTVGTAQDEAAPVTITDGVPSCPSGYTFCAYYKAIINQIRANAPHAMIFCLSEYDNVIKGSAKAQAVVDVADWFYAQGDKLVHHLETGGVPDSGMSLGSHYSTVGYAYIAKRVDEEVNKIVYQYREDIEIKFFGSYNTDHNADSPWE